MQINKATAFTDNQMYGNIECASVHSGQLLTK